MHSNGRYGTELVGVVSDRVLTGRVKAGVVGPSAVAICGGGVHPRTFYGQGTAPKKRPSPVAFEWLNQTQREPVLIVLAARIEKWPVPLQIGLSRTGICVVYSTTLSWSLLLFSATARYEDTRPTSRRNCRKTDRLKRRTRRRGRTPTVFAGHPMEAGKIRCQGNLFDDDIQPRSAVVGYSSISWGGD